MPVIFLALLAFQIGTVNVRIAQAQSGPITSPITSPITAPISYSIVGRVFYMASGSARPAANVRVWTPRPSGGSFIAITDANGRYRLDVPAGTYTVSAYDFRGSIFRPAYRIVNVLSGNAFGINFGAHI